MSLRSKFQNFIHNYEDIFKQSFYDYAENDNKTYFLSIVNFDSSQQDALREVPDNRLLLESDAPYFPWPGHSHSSPSYIGQLAHAMAQVCSVDGRRILELAVQNVESLYKICW